ncbi:MAG: phosphatidate cytidylyltransferase [Woeseiaceae bacterium]
MLRQRILTALAAIVVVMIALFVLPESATRLVVASLMLLAAWEWSNLLRIENEIFRACFVALIAALMAVIWLFMPDPFQVGKIFGLAVAWWVFAFAWLFFHPTVIPPLLAWICGVLIIVPAWLAVDWLYRYDNLSLLLVLVIVVAADSGAFFAGKFFGKVKLAPSISPGKTWEGVFGGMFAVTVIGVAAAVQTGQSMSIVLPLFIVIAVFSIVGDLTVSVFKRNAGVKDSGKLFPGHGGVLDRIDSIAAATPAFALAIALGAIA